MIPVLALVLIGWPAILASLVLSALGIVRRDARWLVGGGVLCVGFAWYLTGWPNPFMKALGYALPFLHIGAGIAVRRRTLWIAWTLLLPHALIALVLSVIVLTQ